MTYRTLYWLCVCYSEGVETGTYQFFLVRCPRRPIATTRCKVSNIHKTFGWKDNVGCLAAILSVQIVQTHSDSWVKVSMRSYETFCLLNLKFSDTCPCIYSYIIVAHLEWPFPYPLGVGLVLLLHSFRSRATSWVTPTPVMSSLICWCHVFLGRPRRLVPGIARSITLRVTSFASRCWICPNQRRRPLRITSSIDETCRMR